MGFENSEIALMYSGGLDTTYTAVQLAGQFKKIHLLTFCNGYCLRVNSSKRHVRILRERFGADRFEHSVISVAGILAFIRKGLGGDMVRARSPLLFDLCCRLSMEAATVFYCLEKGIRCATDGNNPRTQGEIFLQQEAYLKRTGEFFSKYGIRYVRPCVPLGTRDAITKALEAAGIKTGVGVLGRIGITTQLFTQPFCLWAIVAFIFTSKLRLLPFVRYFSLSTDDAIAIRSQKEKLAGACIEYLRVHSSLARSYPCKRSLSGLFRFIHGRC